MFELALPPIVVEGVVVHSSLDDLPWPGSPLLGGALVWTPAGHADIVASIRWHSRPWWRRVLRSRPGRR